MAEAPAVNETLTPDDAVDVLEELLPAQNKSYELGLKLKLRQHEVDSIHSTYSKPRSRLLHVLIEFTNQTEPRPTWRVIVQALRSPAVNLPALARRVEAAHFPDPTAKRDVVAETTDTESAANSTAGNDDEVKSKTLSHPSPTTEAVEAVRTEIKGLHRRFNSLKELTIQGLERCRVAVLTVVYTLTTILTMQEHKGFLEKKLKSLSESSNHWELFGKLNLYWNYLSCSLLEHLIQEFALKHDCLQTVVGEMAVYKKDLEEFRMRTTLPLFVEADPRTLDEDPPPGFRKMVVKFDWPQTATLEDVEKFRRRYATSYDLQTCAMMLNSIRTGSFTVTWFIPVSVVEMLRKKSALAVFKEFSVTRLEIHTLTQICVYQTAPPSTTQSSQLAAAVHGAPYSMSHEVKPRSLMVQPVKWPFKLHWRKGRKIPTNGLQRALTVVIGGMLYCSDRVSVMQYDIQNEIWSELPKPPLQYFAMTSFKGLLTLAGGNRHSDDPDARITVWDSDRKEWVHRYPPMPTARANAGAVGHHKYLIVAGGESKNDEVEVFDSSTEQWYSPEPLLQSGLVQFSAVVGTCWYLCLAGRYRNKHLVSVQLPSLVSGATTGRSIWHELSLPSITTAQGTTKQWRQVEEVQEIKVSTLVALQGHLLLVEGQSIHHYNPKRNQWNDCGQLPTTMDAPVCAVLPSGELMVGEGKEPCYASTRRMWIGHAEEQN